MLKYTIVTELPAVKSISGPTLEENVSIVTDSRKFSNDKMDVLQMFVALRGENFDGSDYLEEIIGQGCKVVAFTMNEKNRGKIEELKKSFDDVLFIEVEDGIKYLQQAARQHMLDWRDGNLERKLIGITGSNGKTTTKEMLFHLLDRIRPGEVLCTDGNLNNHIGVPLTLLQLRECHNFAIVEMGSNHPGEIKELCDIATPTSGIITNIGKSHLEFLKDESGVFVEKVALYNSVKRDMRKGDVFLLNIDDSNLANLAHFDGVVTYGQNGGDVCYTASTDEISLNWGKETVSIDRTNLKEGHNVINMVGAFSIALELFPKSGDLLASAASTFASKKNRSEWIHRDGKSFYLDAYNANPSSMEVAISYFAKQCKSDNVGIKECLYVLGDMNELGASAQSGHQDIGRVLSKLGVTEAIFVGKYADYYLKGIELKCRSFLETNSLEKEWPEIKKRYKYFFLKGSRSLQLESLMDIT